MFIISSKNTKIFARAEGEFFLEKSPQNIKKEKKRKKKNPGQLP